MDNVLLSRIRQEAYEAGYNDGLTEGYNLVAKKIAPTIDVPDRKVGEWIWMGDKGDSRWMCSVCKGKENVPTIMGKPIVWDYCPNCGSEMKGEKSDLG